MTVNTPTYICRRWITIKGKRIYASSYGKKAFCFWVYPKEETKENEKPAVEEQA